MSELNKKGCDRLYEWRSRPLEKSYPYGLPGRDGDELPVDGGTEPFLRARGGQSERGRCAGSDPVWPTGRRRTKPPGFRFVSEAVQRAWASRSGVRFAVSDACIGLVEARSEVFPDAA